MRRHGAVLCDLHQPAPPRFTARPADDAPRFAVALAVRLRNAGARPALGQFDPSHGRFPPTKSSPGRVRQSVSVRAASRTKTVRYAESPKSPGFSVTFAPGFRRQFSPRLASWPGRRARTKGLTSIGCFVTSVGAASVRLLSWVGRTETAVRPHASDYPSPPVAAATHPCGGAFRPQPYPSPAGIACCFGSAWAGASASQTTS